MTFSVSAPSLRQRGNAEPEEEPMVFSRDTEAEQAKRVVDQQAAQAIEIWAVKAISIWLESVQQRPRVRQTK